MNKWVVFLFTGALFAATAWAASIEGLLNEGNKFWAEGQLEQAEASFREAIRLDPEAALPHARLAGLLQSQQRNDEARVEYQNAIMNDPENPSLFLGLAIVYLHDQSYGQAQAMINVAMGLAPDLEQVHKLQQYLTAKLNRLETADTPAAMPQDSIHGATNDPAGDAAESAVPQDAIHGSEPDVGQTASH